MTYYPPDTRMTTAAQLRDIAWRNPNVARYIRASFRNLDDKQPLDAAKAIRLLANNARDAARSKRLNVSNDILTQCAHMLLDDWHARRATTE